MPVVETIPAGTARPKAWVAWSTSPWVQPGPTRTVRAAGSTRMPVIAGEVDDEAVVDAGEAGAVVAAAADGDGQAVVAAEADRGDHVGHVGAAGDQAGAQGDHAVVDGAGGLVAGVVGGEDLAAQRRRQRRGKSFIEHRMVSVQIAMAMRRG